MKLSMKLSGRTSILSVVSLAFVSSSLAATKTYQVTGPVLEMSETSVTVQKGKEKWEIARDASTETKGELKKGDKVTVEYRMMAASIENKSGAKAAPKAPAKK